MALTGFQRSLCRLLAQNRIAAGESYVAGGAALNELIAASRVSRDLDLFHDTDAALAATWDADRRLIESHGFGIRVLRERPSYIEAQVSKGPDAVPSIPSTSPRTRSWRWWDGWRFGTGLMSFIATIGSNRLAT
jgi:hypothetical protein